MCIEQIIYIIEYTFVYSHKLAQYINLNIVYKTTAVNCLISRRDNKNGKCDKLTMLREAIK